MTTAKTTPSAPLAPPSMLDGLKRIKVPKSFDLLSEQLQAEIMSGNYPPGASLPTERELVAATGLSRGSVRESLRMLEAQGLLQTKAGRYGGSVVAAPTDALLNRHINVYAKGRSVPWTALVEVRQALEPTVAALAARNRSDDDLAELRRIAGRLDQAAANDVPAFLDENANWHAAIAAASRNDLLRALYSSVSGLMMEASQIKNFASEEIRQKVMLAHRRILDAIERRDEDAARRRTERDVQAYARYLEAVVQATGGFVDSSDLQR